MGLERLRIRVLRGRNRGGNKGMVGGVGLVVEDEDICSC